AGYLQLDILSDKFYHDLVDVDDSPEPAALHEYIDTRLDEHYHRGHLDYSPHIDEYLRLEANKDLRNEPGLVTEAIHAAMDRYLEQRSYLQIDPDEIPEEVFDIDEATPFAALPLPSSEAGDSFPTSSQHP